MHPPPVGRLPVDPWLQCELWLSAPFRGEILWAYNAAHLAFLREYVAAVLRERSPDKDPTQVKNASVASTLPAWIKAAGNREALLVLIDELARTLTSVQRSNDIATSRHTGGALSLKMTAGQIPWRVRPAWIWWALLGLNQ